MQENQDNNNSQAVLHFELESLENNNFHILLPGEFCGVFGDFIIDTGATLSVIDSHVLPEGIEGKLVTDCKSSSISGLIDDVHILTVDDFKLDNICFKDTRLAVIDLSHVTTLYAESLSRQVIGLIGCDFCVKYGAIINYQERTVTLSL